MYFEYGNKEIEYLKSRDKQLGDAIEQIGNIQRKINTDIYSAVIHTIIGQQISTKAQETIWQRFIDEFKDVAVNNIDNSSIEKLQSLGITFRKAEYIKDFTCKVKSGEFAIDNLKNMADEEVIREFSSLKGIGVWTAEMLLLFCMQRPDILSYGDLAILRGMRMLYHHRKITPQLFKKYKNRYSPYGSVASLYLWAIAGGAIPNMKDYAPTGKSKKRS